MPKFRYSLRTDWLFYLLIVSYAYLIGTMTEALWFGGGVNIFASYSDATTAEQMVVDANKVYWSKTSFLFLSMFLFGMNFDYRAALGIAASFWAGSLIYMFGPTPVLGVALLNAVGLIVLQTIRGEIWTRREHT
ncbi:MAG: hypothetical protein AAF668_04640 [Pseudomonadota bacterium]